MAVIPVMGMADESKTSAARPCSIGSLSEPRKRGEGVERWPSLVGKQHHFTPRSHPSLVSAGVGAALHPFLLLHPPNLGPRPLGRSASTEASLRSATIPGFPTPGFLPVSPSRRPAPEGAARWRTVAAWLKPRLRRLLPRHLLPA